MFIKDVGHAILESYSRIIESLAFTIMSRIEDVLYADHIARNPSDASFRRNPIQRSPSMELSRNFQSFEEEILKINSSKMLNSMTLLDFMGWSSEQEFVKLGDQAIKLPNIGTNKKAGSYLETLGGLNSPTSRH